MTEDELVGWCHQLDGHEFEQVPGIGDRIQVDEKLYKWYYIIPSKLIF